MDLIAASNLIPPPGHFNSHEQAASGDLMGAWLPGFNCKASNSQRPGVEH